MDEFLLKKTSTGGYGVVYPNEGVRYWLNQRGGKWTCGCPGFQHRGKCKHVEKLESMGEQKVVKHGIEARIAQIEKSLNIWKERVEADPSKRNKDMLAKRQQALDEANKKLEEERKKPKPQRHPRSQFEKFIPQVEEIFEGFPKWEIVGSWRRGAPTYKDIDVIVVASVPQFSKIYERLSADPDYEEIMHGPDLIRGYYHGEMFDVSRVPNPDEWGAFLMYRTGSADFNIALRGKLKSFGWGLSERGLLDENKNVVASKTEDEIFEAMGIPFIPPADREKGKFEKFVRNINEKTISYEFKET